MPISPLVTTGVALTGDLPLTYQWRFNTLQIQGATNAMLALFNVSASDAGDYDVTVANPGGVTTSEAAALVICVRPRLAWQPISNNVPHLILTGTAGDRYAIESSSNFVEWSTALIVTNTSGMMLLDVPVSNASQTYYRGRLLP